MQNQGFKSQGQTEKLRDPANKASSSGPGEKEQSGNVKIGNSSLYCGGEDLGMVNRLSYNDGSSRLDEREGSFGARSSVTRWVQGAEYGVHLADKHI